MCNLTIDDIHKIREEHYNKTKNMSFEEYKKELKIETAPIIELLKTMKENNLKH